MSRCPTVYPTNPAFVLESPQVQRAANNVYEYKTAYDAAKAAAGSKRVYRFKSDLERMQYKIGNFGLNSQGQAPG
jgi:hypothetical protein